MVVERRGQRTLVRQHPITIEGQEIGSFEIAFTCSDKPDTYRVSYHERRVRPQFARDRDRSPRGGGDFDPARAFVPASLLTLEESAPGTGSRGAVVQARGTIAASYLQTALASTTGDAVASSSQQGLIVATTTIDKVRTVIRLGQTGLPEGLRQLSSTCEDTFPN